MIYVQIETEELVIDTFLLPDIPRVGDTIFISYRSRLNQPAGLFTEESMAQARLMDGTDWTVVRVQWEASIDRDGRCSVVVEPPRRARS